MLERMNGRSAALWCVLVLCGAWAWFAIAGYTGVNGQDAHDYWRIARAWSMWSVGDAPPKMVEHPHGYPIAGAMLGEVIGSERTALRLISACTLLAVVLLWQRLLGRVFGAGREQHLFLLFALVLSPFLLRYSLVVMSDVPAIALVAASFYFTLGWIERGHWWTGVVALLCLVIALTVRLAVAPLIPVFALAWFHGPIRGRVVRWRKIAAVGLVAVILLLVLIPWIEWSGYVAASPLADWSLWNLFRRELVSDDGVLRYPLPTLIYLFSVAVHPGFIPIGAVLLPFVRWPDLRMLHARLAIALIIIYLLFIGGLPFQNDRVLLFIQPFVVLLFYPAFTRALVFLRTRHVCVAIVLALLGLVQIGLFIRAMYPFIAQGQVERELATQVNAMQPAQVYTHGMGAAFTNLCPDVQVTELWYAELDTFAPAALIVVNPENLEDQWQGRPPLINWQRAQRQGVRQLHVRDDGWSIGRVVYPGEGSATTR